jgi:hypothetical protein
MLMYSLPAKRLIAPAPRPRALVEVPESRDEADARAALAAIIDAQRRLAAELHGRAPGPDAEARALLDALARATQILQAAAAPKPADEVTPCWICGEPIVAGRLAERRDVLRHMSVCSRP